VQISPGNTVEERKSAEKSVAFGCEKKPEFRSQEGGKGRAKVSDTRNAYFLGEERRGGGGKKRSGES